MSFIDQLLTSAEIVGSPYVLLAVVVGTAMGIIVGALPGFTATMGVAILLPFTFATPPEIGITLLLGVYVGAIYGGSISAILINVPGTPAAMITTIDGYALARRGRAGEALGVATVSSCVGGVISAIVLGLAAPQIAEFGLMFSAPEYVGLVVFALSVMAYVAPDSVVKGLVGGLLGLLLATIGMDPNTSYPRFTFGREDLLGGLELVPVMIGLFGFAEALNHVAGRRRAYAPVTEALTNVVPRIKTLLKLWKVFTRSSVIGLAVGVMPAAGPTIASVIAYNEARRNSRTPEEFGKGAVEGVAAPETANNASTGGDLIPTLALGIPGDAVTAVLMGAFMIKGLIPGPLLFRDHRDLVYALFMVLILANLCFGVMGLIGARLFSRVVRVPRYFLTPGVIVLCVVGSFALANSVFDVIVMFMFGIFGFILQRLGIPAPPIILGLILGPMGEENLRRALDMFEGDWTIFVRRPISATLLGLAAFSMAWPLIRGVSRRAGLWKAVTNLRLALPRRARGDS